MEKIPHSIKSAAVAMENLTKHEKTGRTPRHGITLFDGALPACHLEINPGTPGYPEIQGPESRKLARETMELIEDGLKFRAGKQAWIEYLKAGIAALFCHTYPKPGQVWKKKGEFISCEIESVDDTHVAFYSLTSPEKHEVSIKSFLKNWKHTPDLCHIPFGETASDSEKREKSIHIGDTWRTFQQYWNSSDRIHPENHKYEAFDVTVTDVDENNVHFRYDKFASMGEQVATCAEFLNHFKFIRYFNPENSWSPKSFRITDDSPDNGNYGNSPVIS